MKIPTCFSFMLATAAAAATLSVSGSLGTAALAQTTAPAPPPLLSFQITDLPLLPNTSSSRAAAINNAGQVVGMVGKTTAKTSPGWLWTPGTPTAPAKLETLALLPNSTRCEPKDINDKGYVAGRSLDVSNQKAMLWLPGKLGDPIDCTAAARTAGLLPGWVLRDARALSNLDASDAYYVVGIGDFTDPTTKVVTTNRGLVWTMRNGIMVNAAILECPDADPANASVHPRDVNAMGHVAGDYDPNWMTSVVVRSPHIWSAQDGKIIQKIPVTRATDTYAINGAGTIAGYSFGSSSAFLSATPYSTFDTLTTEPAGVYGDKGSRAYGLNNRNQVVGEVTGPIQVPCLWQVQVDGVTGQPLRDTATGALLYDFYDLFFDASKCRITGTTVLKTVSIAKAINDAGWIIGQGKTSTLERAFLLVPNK